MEDLKRIWNKVNDLQLDIETLLDSKTVEHTYQILKKEEKNQKKWTPLVIPIILITMLVFTWVTQAYQTIVSMTGIVLITIGAFVMIRLLQMHQISIDQYEHDRDVISFLKIVKERLAKRKHTWALGVIIYTFSLTIGLHLLIFRLDSLAGLWGQVGLLWGMMLGLTGYAGGSMYLIHQKRYGAILNRINHFLED